MKGKLLKILLFSLTGFMSMMLQAQVGIGTTTPSASSILELASTTQGMLAPRMTSAQRADILSPANGLMVYDTDNKALYFYDASASTWVKSLGDKDERSNFKRIKSTDVLATVLAAERAAGGGTKYLLNATTLYEINGTVIFDLPVELNNAYVYGLDSSDDKMIRAGGDLFTGSSGGSIKSLTLNVTGGKLFNLMGNGTQGLIFRDCIVAGCTNVGVIDNFFFVFNSIVQYTGNTTGIIYKNTAKLLLSNTAWFSTNTGTYEKLEGTFGLVLKQGGFLEVTGSAIGFDVSANPVITGDAIMESVVFTGSNTAGYVSKYTTGSYLNYNFNNSWAIRCTGIPTEADAQATANLYLDRTQAVPTVTPNATNSTPPYSKVPGTTIATNLFRVGTGTSPVSSASNRLQYIGKKSRIFNLNAAVSIQGSSGTSDHLFFFVKFTAAGIATILNATETYIDTDSGHVQNFSVSGTAQLNSGDYVELHVARVAGEAVKTLSIRSLSMSMN